MPRAEAGTPKAIANGMKSKGLQRLRWYCQVCEKQCRDENGFKCHAQSEAHLRQMLVVGENAGKHISNYSMEFQSAFVGMLSRRFGTKRVLANRVYQEYISDKSHLHMNATRWVTLTEFCKHLGRSGIARVDETEKGWFIAWIDNSPKALAKQEASMKKERQTMSDEQRERNLIAEQIQRAAAEEAEKSAGLSGEGSSSSTPLVGQELKRDEGEKLTLSFSSKPLTLSAPSQSSSSGVPLKLKSNPLKPANPLKRANPLKANPLKTKPPNPSSESSSPAGQKRSAEVNDDDQDAKRRKVDPTTA
ncbi:domain of Kin17 curved DNA-binding protein-domain-containing protein [Flagelloscypha sp. PMI_526]|nr:domain of Kin17 curved DNA-binding protein-domain-containing protein [Flagelloscypha sp. PMI_526]